MTLGGDTEAKVRGGFPDKGREGCDVGSVPVVFLHGSVPFSNGIFNGLTRVNIRLTLVVVQVFEETRFELILERIRLNQEVSEGLSCSV